ncbi:MAG: winged helix-turn-helix transcriptional regulator [Olivibacter sp.]|nr:winged helix-turn-helix transcriptional regulator [Olivibacter sp. UJ_SKK_5.1]
MEEGWKHYTDTAPIFEQGTNFTKVEFWLSAKEIQGGQKGGQKGGQTGGQTGGNFDVLTDRQREALTLIKAKRSIGRKELSAILNINESAVQKILNVLKSKGYIQRGGRATFGGYWEILKE